MRNGSYTSIKIAQFSERNEVARPFDLPSEAEDARRVVAQLVSTLERVGQVHKFVKGMGLAAPQIGIGRSAAVIRTPEGETVTLLNPRISDESDTTATFCTNVSVRPVMITRSVATSLRFRICEAGPETRA